MSRTYLIKLARDVMALRGLHEWALQMAQTAVVIGGAAPRAVVREVEAVLARLVAAGWLRLGRPEVREQETMHERR